MLYILTIYNTKCSNITHESGTFAPLVFKCFIGHLPPSLDEISPWTFAPQEEILPYITCN